MADPRKIIQLATSVPKMLEELSRASAKTKSLSSAEREANLQKFLDLSSIKDRLYHATRATEGGKGTEAIRTIKPSKEGALGSGAYLTPSTAHASTYSGLPNDEAIEMMRSFSPDMAKQVLDSREQRKILDSQVGGNMLPVYAQIRNPLVIEGSGDPMIEALIKLGMDEGKASKMVENAYDRKGYIGKQVQNRAQAAGYDGLMQYRNGELSEVLPFSSNQVKSAIGNEGTYDISSPELNKKKGGAINLFEGTTEILRRKLKEAGERRTARQDQMTHGPAYDPTERDKIRESVKQWPAVAMTWPLDMVDFGASALANVASKTSPRLSGFVAASPATPFAPSVRERINYGLYGTQPRERSEMRDPDSTNLIYDFLNPLALINPTGAVRMAARGAKNLAPTAAKLAEDYLMRTGQILPVIKPSGGNWLQGNVENSMKGLRSRGPTEFDREWLIRHADQEPIAIQRILQAIPQNEAINQFVDKQLTGYVKNQMGTAGDPIRLAADAFPEQKAKLLFDKQKQIDKATADMEKARLARGFTPEMMTRSQARIRELEKERELIELRTGLHYEPQSAEVASDQARRAAGYPPDPVSTSPLGQAWENISDASIEGAPYRMSLPMVTPETAPDALRALGGEFAVQNPNAMAYSIKGGDLNDVMTSRNLGFGHIMDELRNATNVESGLPKELLIDPKNLSKWTAQQSVEHVDKINAWRAVQKAEADLVRANNAATVMHKDYPEKGMKWVELKTPEGQKPADWDSYTPAEKNNYLSLPNKQGEAQLADALKYEGEQLQHCVGGYCPDVVSGKSRIFSLRDAKGKPHATIEVAPPDFDATGMNEAQLAMAKGHRMSPEQRIIQIKAMKNRAPNEEYLPYVQDFVRSGKWSDVGDFQNTGLHRKSDFIDQFTSDQLDAVSAGEYMTKQELDSLMLPNIYPPKINDGMKRGGPVNQDAMQMAVWNKAIRKQVGGDPTQAEIDAATLPARMNPKLAAQGQKYARPSEGFLRDPQSYKDMAGNLLEMISPPVPTPEEARAGLGSTRADSQLKGSVMQGYPDAQGLLADQAYDKMSNIAMAGMNVYHGTPHRFPPTKNNPLGEFDPMKIGTGEGAQAYGAGAGYLAEVKDLAKGYQKRLSNIMTDGGYDSIPRTVTYGSANPRRVDLKAPSESLTPAEIALTHAGITGSPFYAAQEIRQMIAANPPDIEKYKKALAFLESGKLKASKIGTESGYLYKVDLPDEQIAKMLDWDKPLSQQSAIADSIKGAGGKVYSAAWYLPTPRGETYPIKVSLMDGDYPMTGRQLYQRVSQELGGDEAASQYFKDLKIPGIRYLDQGSRTGGAGTSNFVVFDPAHMNIIGREKNGGLVNQDAMNMAVWDKAVRKGGGGRMNAAEMALNLIKKGAKALDVSNELKSAAAARTAAGVLDLPPAIKTGVKAGLQKPTAVLSNADKAEARMVTLKDFKALGRDDKVRAIASARAAADKTGVARTTQGLSEAFPEESDMVSSFMTSAPYKIRNVVPDEVVDAANAARKSLRSEPATTPGANASEKEWAAWGKSHGVNMTLTKPQSLGISDLTSGREVMIPGGLSGKFTIPDMFWMKSNNINPASLPQDVHTELMKKFIRTHENKNPDAVDIFNQLDFALLSPSAPLVPNEFLTQRLRIKDMDELRALAGRVGESGLDQSLVNESGVGAALGGGLGIRGTANLKNQAVLADLILKKPEMFQAGPGETLRDVTIRVMNQVPGLGTKTASLGTPWLDLSKANTSAVDLHMIRDATPRLLQDPVVGDAFRSRMANLLGTEPTVEAILAMDPRMVQEAAIKIVGASQSKNYRLASGALNDIPAMATPDKLLNEPSSFTDFGPFYNRVVDYVDQSRGLNPEIALFPEQWRKWDVIRQRIEPHEFAHPDWRKLPKQSFNEMQDSLKEHSRVGYKQSINPTMKTSDWRKLYYGKVDPELLIPLAGGAAAASAYLADEAKDQKKGGKVQKKAAGGLTSDDLVLEERKL